MKSFQIYKTLTWTKLSLRLSVKYRLPVLFNRLWYEERLPSRPHDTGKWSKGYCCSAETRRPEGWQTKHWSPVSTPITTQMDYLPLKKTISNEYYVLKELLLTYLHYTWLAYILPHALYVQGDWGYVFVSSSLLARILKVVVQILCGSKRHARMGSGGMLPQKILKNWSLLDVISAILTAVNVFQFTF